jgi:hypothetical protein
MLLRCASIAALMLLSATHALSDSSTSSRSAGAGTSSRGTRAGDNINNINHNDDDDDSDTMTFKHFIAHNRSMTCSSDEHARPFNNQIRGVNLGGWMVLEPWITPSLFYQFLGGDEHTAAFDMYTFCDRLGAKRANKQLRRHWETWVTEDIIQQLASSGAVNSLRLPVGDFMYKPYGPYAECVDGSLDYIDQLLDWAYTYGLSVLFDVHTMKDSQNGFDNSGQAMGFEWTSALNSEFSGLTTFEHWYVLYCIVLSFVQYDDIDSFRSFVRWYRSRSYAVRLLGCLIRAFTAYLIRLSAYLSFR